MLWALVMAGGRGTRLKPLTLKTPKPLLKLFRGEQSLLSETLKRIAPLVPSSRTLVIGNQEFIRALRKVARRVPRSQVIAEPVSRNTAATVGLGAAHILKWDSDARVLVLPADHRIRNKRKFQIAVKQAETLAMRTNGFSILGIRPTSASSFYGYIEMGKRISDSAFRLKRFVEKPNERRARRFVRSHRFLWHAGIFLAPAKTILRSIEHYQPRLASRLRTIYVKGGAVRPQAAFKKLPDISIDYAVLERVKSASLVP